MKPNNKRNGSIFIILMFSIGLVLLVNSSASPLPGGHVDPSTLDPYDCHSQSGYYISVDVTSIQLESGGGNFTVVLTATGTNVTFRFVDGARDNDLFTINASHEIWDAHPEDEELSPGFIRVTMNIASPSK